MSYYDTIALDKCCYTCKQNENNLKPYTFCICKISNNDGESQDMWCEKYEACKEYNN